MPDDVLDLEVGVRVGPDEVKGAGDEVGGGRDEPGRAAVDDALFVALHGLGAQMAFLAHQLCEQGGCAIALGLVVRGDAREGRLGELVHQRVVADADHGDDFRDLEVRDAAEPQHLRAEDVAGRHHGSRLGKGLEPLDETGATVPERAGALENRDLAPILLQPRGEAVEVPDRPPCAVRIGDVAERAEGSERKEVLGGEDADAEVVAHREADGASAREFLRPRRAEDDERHVRRADDGVEVGNGLLADDDAADPGLDLGAVGLGRELCGARVQPDRPAVLLAGEVRHPGEEVPLGVSCGMHAEENFFHARYYSKLLRDYFIKVVRSSSECDKISASVFRRRRY